MKFQINVGAASSEPALDLGEEIKKLPFIQQEGPVAILVRMALVIVVTLIITQTVRYFWKRKSKEKEMKIHQKFLYNIFNILLYITGFIIAISQIEGAGDILSMVLAGSGFLALAVGLAAQESLGNLINGMVLTVSKPFEVGDRVRLINNDITGYIEDITMRHTIMRTFVNSRLIIPNSSLNKEIIENSSYQIAQASNFVDVTITNDSDLDLAMEIIAEKIGNHPWFLDRRTPVERQTQPKVQVFVRNLGLNGVELRASMWTRDVNDNFEACSDARYAIKKAFDAQGILLAQLPARPSEYARAGAIPSESGHYPGENGAQPSSVVDDSEMYQK